MKRVFDDFDHGVRNFTVSPPDVRVQGVLAAWVGFAISEENEKDH